MLETLLTSAWLPWALWLLSEGLGKSPLKSNGIVELVVNAAKTVLELIKKR